MTQLSFHTNSASVWVQCIKENWYLYLEPWSSGKTRLAVCVCVSLCSVHSSGRAAGRWQQTEEAQRRSSALFSSNRCWSLAASAAVLPTFNTRTRPLVRMEPFFFLYQGRGSPWSGSSFSQMVVSWERRRRLFSEGSTICNNSLIMPELSFGSCVLLLLLLRLNRGSSVPVFGVIWAGG